MDERPVLLAVVAGGFHLLTSVAMATKPTIGATAENYSAGRNSRSPTDVILPDDIRAKNHACRSR